MGEPELLIGLDVGSASVKVAVIDPGDDRILWSEYERHETRQYEKCLDLLLRIESAFPDVPQNAFRVFVSGTGGADVGALIGGCFIQEVNAVCLAVEKYYPDARSVVELGGEDAKIIVFKTDPRTGRRRRQASMNDKCAGGTGAVIDKISAKLGITPGDLRRVRYAGARLHPVAGKCGVFAETDINGLQKQGVPPHELMASLFESIVQQNLSVLTRGHTLYPPVLLLGGPNVFLPGMQECWRNSIVRLWEERGIVVPEGVPLEEQIFVPENALLFGALGAAEFAKREFEDDPDLGLYLGTERLRWYLDVGRWEQRYEGGARRASLVGNDVDLHTFKQQYAPAPSHPSPLHTFTPFSPAGSVVEAFLGVDGGSTSTKAVLIDPDGEVIAKAYRLSQGNPIKDSQEVCGQLHDFIRDQGCTLKILGAATTGYARDILKEALAADVALVETVAHMHSGLREYPEADVICDVGGQDIKIIMLKNGRVKDFRLNTQCSAGNGYYLQATAEAFGYRVEDYAEVAFSARTMPEFGHGCVVFLQTDIVDFQRKGWQPNEIMAGLAAVLPRNIWLYVCQIPDLVRLGKTFVLQGGTQHNLAAVKAQADFIRSRFKGSPVAPRIVVHKHCGESGAIGCALETQRLFAQAPYRTSFIGFEALQSITYKTTRDESTRCTRCANKCARTFIDLRSIPSITSTSSINRRIILANCEKGAAENREQMRRISKRIQAVKEATPNLAAVSALEVFRPPEVERIADGPPGIPWYVRGSRRRALARRADRFRDRGVLRIGIPRVLNMYSCAPFFMGYFISLGVRAENIIWSDYTSERLYKEGINRGSVDPCYPSKLAIPHVHNLLYDKHRGGAPLTHLFFPLLNSLPASLRDTVASRCCPGGTATPEAAHAAFVTESDLFAEHGIVFKKTFLDLDDPHRCARQLYEDWVDEMGLSEAESARAVAQGLAALDRYQDARRREARHVLDRLHREDRLGIVVLARPYHNDPGINHGLFEEFQKRGYPILTHDSLPTDADILDVLFGEEIGAGELDSPLHIDDVWKNSFAENSSRKVWAAKYTARHPNLIALELSSFKCGHDAPIYSAIEEIVEASGTPFFYFKDIDENKPVSSFKMRIQTITYFLERYAQQAGPQGDAQSEAAEAAPFAARTADAR